MIRQDNSGSDIYVKGPYARSVEAAIEGLDKYLGFKILQKAAESGEAQVLDWASIPPTKATDEASGDEPGLPCTTWAGVNVSVVTQDDLAREEAEEEEGQCRGEYVQRINQAGFLAGLFGPR